MDTGCPGRRLAWGVLLFALLSPGCAAKLQMSAAELSQTTPTQGIVVGSVVIRGGGDILGRTAWDLYVTRVTSPLASLVPSGPGYVLNATREGPEEVFVTRLEAGDYQFSKLEQPGFSSAFATTNVRFRVQTGTTLYIGRLVIEFPSGWMHVGTRLHIFVEDAKASTLDTAHERHGLDVDDVVTELMTPLD